MKLIDCPVGLFEFNEILCLKTQYILPDGRVEAYVVSTGESLFESLDGIKDFNDLEVIPLKLRWGSVIVTNIDAMAKG